MFMANTTNTNTSTATNINIGTVRPTGEPGSSKAFASFTMYGITFEVVHLVRKSQKIDSVELYTKHDSSWCSDFLKYVDRTAPCAVGQVALRLLAVAEAGIPDCTAQRFAMIELY